MIKTTLAIMLAYFWGSIPSALIIGKVFLNKDVRKHGSGNIGATNAARTLGFKYGIMTLVFDLIKGLVPTYIAYKIGPEVGAIAAVMAILGHSYSIFINFQGGKAVATTLGAFIIVSPYSILTLIFIFFITIFLTSYVSVASMTCAIFLPILVFLFHGTKIEIGIALFIGLLVIYRHRSNIKNLIEGKEAKFLTKDKD